jgi:hypothetical protein
VLLFSFLIFGFLKFLVLFFFFTFGSPLIVKHETLNCLRFCYYYPSLLKTPSSLSIIVSALCFSCVSSHIVVWK